MYEVEAESTRLGLSGCDELVQVCIDLGCIWCC